MTLNLLTPVERFIARHGMPRMSIGAAICSSGTIDNLRNYARQRLHRRLFIAAAYAGVHSLAVTYGGELFTPIERVVSIVAAVLGLGFSAMAAQALLEFFAHEMASPALLSRLSQAIDNHPTQAHAAKQYLQAREDAVNARHGIAPLTRWEAYALLNDVNTGALRSTMTS